MLGRLGGGDADGYMLRHARSRSRSGARRSSSSSARTRYGYDTEYLGWVVNREELLEVAREAGLELVREILLPDYLSAGGAPEAPVDHRGFLFAPAR